MDTNTLIDILNMNGFPRLPHELQADIRNALKERDKLRAEVERLQKRIGECEGALSVEQNVAAENERLRTLLSDIRADAIPAPGGYLSSGEMMGRIDKALREE